MDSEYGYILLGFSKGKISLFLLLTLTFASIPAGASARFSRTAVPAIFATMIKSPALADPSVIVIDRLTGEIAFQSNPASLRKPASVMKLLSAAAALSYLDPEKTFMTTLSLSNKPSEIILVGELDPWMTPLHQEAIANQRAWYGTLVNKAISAIKDENRAPVKKISIKYRGIYGADLTQIRIAFRKKGITTTATHISAASASEISVRQVTVTHSPTVSEMLKFALMWSDNVLAERLARLASKSAGYGFDEVGIALTFHAVLVTLGIDDSALRVHDASGLSKSNRVSAKLIGDLLMKLRSDPKYAAVYTGLPIGGISGTLEKRYIKTAPLAVGLIHAKSGTLNGTVTLAGYIDSGDREYAFVIIADKIVKTHAAAVKARSAMDKALGKLAAPLVTPIVQSIDTTTAQLTN